MSSTPRDENRIPALFGVSPIDGETAIPVYVDDTTHELYVKLSTGDIQIGAVEIKNSTDDTRAKVGANGLEVEVKAMPSVTISNPTTNPETGLAKSTKQDDQIVLETTLNSLVDTLQELVQRLSPLAGAMASNAALRIVPLSSVSTAVTGPQTSAQFIATYNAAGVNYTTRVALENNTAIQSNVNNCTGV